VRDGDLRASVRWSGGIGPGGIFEAQPAFAIAGTTVKYAQYHHTGTGRMPQRRFLLPPDPAVFAPLMHEWILRTARAKGKT